MKLKWILITALMIPGGFAVAQMADFNSAMQSAEKGDAEAQFTLGVMYRKGDGVPKDPVQAAAWYRKAAVQGLAEAQLNLGVLYSNGDGVLKDPVQAAAWYRKAAAQDLAEALDDPVLQEPLGQECLEHRQHRRPNVRLRPQRHRERDFAAAVGLRERAGVVRERVLVRLGQAPRKPRRRGDVQQLDAGGA